MITLKTIRERVRGGKVDPLSKMGKSKLTGQEITQYYRDNPDQKKAARDKDVKKAIEIALDMGGAMKVAMREIEKFKRGLTKNPAVKKALQHANESVQEEGGAGDFGTTELRKKYEKDTPKSVNEEMPRHLQQISKMFKTKNDTEIKGIDKLVVMSSMSTVMGMQKQDPRGFKKMVAAIGKLKEGAELDEAMSSGDAISKLFKTKDKKEIDGIANLMNMTSVKVLQSMMKQNPKGFKRMTAKMGELPAMESVIKENGMLNENVIEKMREIVSKKQAMKVSGVMVDMFTASAVVQIYDKVNDANKKKMEKMKPAQLANVAMKIMQKQSVSEGNLFREYEPGEFRNGEEKMYVDIIKKNGGKNIKVAKPDRREPNLSINFKGGNVSKMRQDLDKVDDGLTDIEEAVSPAQQAAIAISKKERGEKPKKENRARRDAMRGMASDDDFRFKKSDDIPTASADDRKAADKNPIIQLRRIADLPKGGEMEFKDGKKSKVSQADAKKALKGFMMMKKGNDKAKFQDNVGRSLKDLKKILRIIK